MVIGFLLFGASVCQAIAGPNEDILAASKAGDRAGVEAALIQGASVNAVDPLAVPSLTPLGLAAYYGHENVAAFLIERGANVTARDGLDDTPLHVAAEHGSTNVAKLLLDRGADANARDFLGTSPLGFAALRGHKSVAALLLARGALVNARTSSAKTPLHLAAAAGNKDVVAFLLAHGADAAARNSDGQTPLEELNSSSLEPAIKKDIARVLGGSAASASRPKPAMSPKKSSVNLQAPQPEGLPVCTDLRGIANFIMQANPRTSPHVLMSAVEQYQVAMGCRQPSPPIMPAPSQTTKCTWEADVFTCRTN
jgi:ankyrin repeat protein